MGEVNDYTALLFGRSWWGEQAARKPVFITYSFEASSYDYLTSKANLKNLANSFQSFTDAQKTAARDALGQWDNASGIVFREAPAGQGDIRFGNYDLSLGGVNARVEGFAYLPSTEIAGDSQDSYSDDYGGDIFVDTAVIGASASDMTHLLAHEIGHAIGLKHPFEGYPTLAKQYDDSTHTVMSYNGKTPTLGPLDIAAAQALYGTEAEDGRQVASWSWNAGKATLTQTGGSGAETIRGVSAADIIRGNAAKDTIFGSGGDDTVDGGSGDDILQGGDGADRLSGGSGGDLVKGQAGDDTLFGDAGNDVLFGNAGNDVFIGGAGKDVFHGGDGSYEERKGSDTADYSTARKSIDVHMDGRNESGAYAGYHADGADIGRDVFDGIANVTGGAAADWIEGDRFGNVLKGNAGNDVLDGGVGQDWLFGGLGRDTLTGGTSADRFVFDSSLGVSNLKTITDFKAGTDKIALDHDRFAGFKKEGLLASALFREGEAARDANDRVIYDKETGALFYDPDGVGGKNQLKLGTLEAGLDLHGSDFLVIA